MSDGPNGIREEISRDSWDPAGWTNDSSSYFPTGAALAATWNPDLAYQEGEALGEEARWRGKDVLFGPGINIQRTPLCGRNFEYMSEVETYPVNFRGVRNEELQAYVDKEVV